MAYGSIKVDNITFTNGGVDQTVTVSGIVQSISGNITATGTIQGATIIGTSTLSGATVTGNAGVFTAITGGTAGFTTITGTTVTGTTANFATLSGTTITGGHVTTASGTYTGNVTAAAFVPTGSTVPTNGVYLPSANSVALATNGTQRLLIDSAGVATIPGKVIFGTLNNIGGAFDITRTTHGVFSGFRTLDGGTNPYLQTGSEAGIVYLNADGSSVPALSLRTQGSERLRITSAGLVGIGTTTVSAALHVVGNEIRFSNSTNASYYGTITHDAATTGANIYNSQDSGGHTFQISGSEKARIDSSGRLLLGTSSDSGGALLQVNGNRVRIATAKTPASASDTGTTGEICWDADYIYVCTATNTWKRTAIATW